MTQARYMTLTGDALIVKKGAGGDDSPLSLKRTFSRSADVYAALLTTAFTAAIQPDSPAGDDNHSISDPASILLVNVFLMFFYRMMENLKLKKVNLNGKCIDTQPDPNTPPTTARFGLAAGEMKSYYRFIGIGIGALQAAYIVAKGNPLDAILGHASFATHMISGYRRFDKVLKGEWQIVDMPTPEKITEMEKADRGKNTTPIAVPTPA